MEPGTLSGTLGDLKSAIQSIIIILDLATAPEPWVSVATFRWYLQFPTCMVKSAGNWLVSFGPLCNGI